MRKEGLQKKSVSSLTVGKQKNQDLESLKKMDGPFTSGESVKEYLENSDIQETKTRDFNLK